MNSELVFKRPGRVELVVSKSEGGFIYARLLQKTAKGWKHLVSVQGIRPTQCRLIDHGGTWMLVVAEANFYVHAKEFKQLRDTFGFEVSDYSKQPEASLASAPAP